MPLEDFNENTRFRSLERALRLSVVPECCSIGTSDLDRGAVEDSLLGPHLSLVAQAVTDADNLKK